MPTTIPTTTSSTRPGSPSTGDAYFETDTNNYIIYDGANWRAYESDRAIYSYSGSNISSVALDGTDDYLSINSASELNFGGGSDLAFSISSWVYIDTLSNFTILTKGVYSSTGEYHVRMTGGQKMQLVLYDGAAFQSCFIDQTLSTGQWYNFVFTYDGRGGTSAKNGILGYLNGSLATLSTASSGSYSAMSNSTAPLYIGRNGSNYSDGIIDEVAFFNSELSASNVTAIYNSGVPSDLTSLNPIAWWRMGDGIEGGSGTTVYDMSGYGNNATLTNGAAYSTNVPS